MNERKKVKDWAAAQITLKMIAAAQQLLVELNGQPVCMLKALRDAFVADSSETMQKKIFSILYEDFERRCDPWEVTMEQQYMVQQNIAYVTDESDVSVSSSPARTLKGCIAMLILIRLNELRASIRRVGERAHGISIKGRRSESSPTHQTTNVWGSSFGKLSLHEEAIYWIQPTTRSDWRTRPKDLLTCYWRGLLLGHCTFYKADE
jgi:hypothetical protein